MPPIVNRARKPIANSIGVLNEMLPRHIVASQLKIFTPVGTATTIVASMNGARTERESPLVNMWCAHTAKPTKPMPNMAIAIALYPKIGLRSLNGVDALLPTNWGGEEKRTPGGGGG